MDEALGAIAKCGIFKESDRDNPGQPLASPNFDRDKAARILCDAVVMGDRAACDKHEISLRSLQRYRQKLDGDPELSQVVAQKREIQDKAWGDEIPAAIASCITYLKGAAQACKSDDPDAVHAVAGALKILSEVSMTKQVIDARLAGQDRQDDNEA